jgi:hypothetical protein
MDTKDLQTHYKVTKVLKKGCIVKIELFFGCTESWSMFLLTEDAYICNSPYFKDSVLVFAAKSCIPYYDWKDDFMEFYSSRYELFYEMK